MRRPFAVAIALVIGFWTQGAWSQDQVGKPADAPILRADANLIRPDPGIRRGVLPNGLRYSVMSGAEPKGALSIRLGIETGSYEETDAERGAAHFIEHMAFNGTKNFPEGGLDKMFSRLGVGFGRDQNASTSMFSTRYDLDLPTFDAAGLDVAFSWLRDVADGVNFDQQAIVRERGVILAEREARLSPVEETFDAVNRFELKGARSLEREPIGTVPTLNAMNAAMLRAFYERWYRPENAIVVAVGDLSLDELERRVTTSFSSWKASSPTHSRVAAGLADTTRGPDLFVRADNATPAMLDVCRVRAPDPRTRLDMERLRRESVGQLARAILNRRLARLAAGEAPPFVNASVNFQDATRDAASTCLLAMPLQDGYETAVTAIETEIRRFLAYGPTPLELEVAIEDMRARYRGAASSSATRNSGSLASGILEAEFDDMVAASPFEAFRAFDRAVGAVTPEDVRAGFARDWSGAGPLLAVVGPKPPQVQTLKAAWEAASAAPPPTRYADVPLPRWGYMDFGPPGRVVRREAISEGEFLRFTFENGVVFNFKHTDFEQSRIGLSVNFGLGRKEFDDEDYFEAKIGSGLFKEGGLQKHGIDDIKALFSTSTWDASLDVGDYAYHLYGETSTNALGGQLTIMAAYLTEPGFRRNIDATLPTTIDAMYRTYRNTPQLVLSEALAKAVSPTGSSGIPPLETMARFRSADVERLLKPAVTESPLELSIVGDIDEASVVDLVSRTFGALPPRTRKPAQALGQSYMRFPNQPLAPIRVTHEGSSEQAVAGVVWPLYVADPARRREEFTLTLIKDIFGQALLKRIREELGKSYAPEADTVMPDFADQGYLMAVLEAYPGDVDEAVAETIRTAQAMAKGEITAEQVETARVPLLSGLATRSRTNDWWLGAMDGSSKNDQGVKDILTMESIIASITLAEVKAVAAKWLARPPIVVIATPTTSRAAAQPGRPGG